jgi:hypothetical protein
MNTKPVSININKRSRFGTVLLSLGILAATASHAWAFDASEFDAETIQTTFEAGLTSLAIIVGGVATLAMGVAIYRKIKSYFAKAG